MVKKNESENIQQPIEPVRSYFTNEINERIASMTNDEMLELLKELENTNMWIAILRYTQQRLQHTQGSLYSADPFKDPTNLARTQGMMLGLSDLQNAVIILVTQKDEE